MGLVSRWRRRRTLDGIAGPTKVDVQAEVLSPDDVVSPLSGMRAALIKWVFVTFASANDRQMGGRRVFLRPFASGFFGEALIVGTPHGTIEVPLEGIVFSGVGDPGDATPIEHPLPAGLAELANRRDLTRGYEVRFRESFLRRRDRVRLRAIVEPIVSEGGVYRGGARAGFVVRGDLGGVRLDDLTLS